jgi:ligand-binding sensor domain-containing protein
MICRVSDHASAWLILFSLIVGSFILSCEADAQNNLFSFQHFGTSEGLSEGRVTCLLQDSKGFLWIGTFNGLNKYDGYNFKHFYATPHDTSGLQGNVITALCEDSAHTIWVGTRRGGLYTIDRRTNHFHRYSHDTLSRRSLSSDDIAGLLCDSKGRLWVATSENGLNYFDRSTSSFVRYAYFKQAAESKSVSDILRLFESLSGTIIINGIINGRGCPIEFDPRTGESRPFALDSNASLFSSIWKSANPAGYFVIPSNGSPTKLFYASGSIAGEQPQSEYILVGTPTFILPRALEGEDSKAIHSYLIGTNRGLCVLDMSNHTVESLPIGSEQQGIAYNNIFTCGLLDKQGRLWVGSYNGLYTLSEDASTFRKHFLQSKVREASGISQTVRSLHVDLHGKLLAGTFSGQLFEWSDEDRKFRTAPSLSGPKNHIPINGIADQPNGTRWLAATSGAFFVQPVGLNKPVCLNDQSCKIKVLSNFPVRISRGCLPTGSCGYVVHYDREGRVWLGSGMTVDKNDATLHSYDSRTGMVESYVYPGSGSEHAGMHGVYAILEDHQNSFWIGTAEGLFLLDRTSKQFTSYLYDPNNKYSLNQNAISTLYEDDRGRIWVGTWSGGLDLFDQKTGRFTHFVEADGLPSNIIYSILEDKAGTLWIATGRGICHFDPDKKTFRNYDVDDGLLDNEFQPNAAAMLPTGEMFFGGNHGVTSFFPERLQEKIPNAPIVVTSFSAGYTPYASELVNGDRVMLDYTQNTLSFEFASLDYSGPTKKRYAYMLQGVDHDWLICGNRNNGSYNNLPPGHYVLRISTATSVGSLNTGGIGIDFFISAPYWQTWWFQLLVGSSIVGLILIWFFRLRARQRVAQVMLDRALENERLNIAGELHDGPLQDLYATRFVLEEISPHANAATFRATTDLDTILKKVRSDLRLITGELQLPRFENGLSQELVQLLEVFGEHNPDLRIITDIEDQPDTLSLKVRQNLFRICRTALANVKRHANASELNARFSQTGRMYEMEIADNGCGFSVPSTFDALGREKHYGLILMHAHAHEIGAKLNISSVPGKETRIHVTYLKRAWLGRANVPRRLFKD